MSKYRNQRCNGYASKREANRAAELQALQAAGKIIELRQQVRFVLLPKTKEFPRPLIYVSDFVYLEIPTDKTKEAIAHCEDSKGYRTPVYKIKRRMMQQLLGITIEEV